MEFPSILGMTLFAITFVIGLVCIMQALEPDYKNGLGLLGIGLILLVISLVILTIELTILFFK